MNIVSGRTLMAAVLCAAIMAAGAQAGPLAVDPNAIWHGTAAPLFFSISAGTTFEISASADFAVYDPGKFNLSFGAGADPSNGTQYVYAYQISNTGANGPNLVAQPISFFSEALGANANAQNIEALPVTYGNFGQLPGNSAFAGTPQSSAGWDYTAHNLALGATSQILLFTSPHGPTFQTGGVSGGGLGAHQPLPSPAPESATWVMLALGGGALLLARRRFAHHSPQKAG